MRSTTVTLGGVAYTVNQLPMRPETEWRKQLQAQLEPLLALMGNYRSVEFNTPADIAAFLAGLAPLLLGAPDIMLKMLYAYSPELARHAGAIESNSYSDEVLAALQEVLGLAFPFARDLAKLGTVLAANGAAPPPLPTT